MSVPGTAPDSLVSLGSILAASAAWVAAGSGASDVYWPDLDGGTAFGATPIAVIDLIDRRTATVSIYADADQFAEQDLQQLARDLVYQLPTRYRADGTGVFIEVEPEISEVEFADLGANAAQGAEIIVIDMTLTIGIEEAN